ncbi:MAG TPA: ABC transporter permease subunit, partial [Solirubrobacterales bacterium]|nr:ABC transporter permease subunit [Solirubrobacterales bacterium]
PFIGKDLISGAEKESVQYVIQLDGTGLVVGIVVLTVMIAPIMIAIVTDALRSVPRGWTEGAVALGVNRFRALRTVGLRAARPAIVAAAVLATARALGEAIMLSMVSGSHAFAPNPLDGVTFFFEPALTFAAAIVDHADELSVKPSGQTIYAFAAILLISSAFLSFAGYVARRSMRKYTLAAR